MNGIYFSMKARVFFEADGIEKFLPQIKKYGRKILIVSGKSFVFTTGLYDRITEILDELARLCEIGAERAAKNMRRHMDRKDYRQILEAAL